MKKTLEFFLSLKFTLLFLIIFFTLTGIATFIENDYGSVAAKGAIYNAWWFELILFSGLVNLVYNIFKRKLYRRDKFSIFLFHQSFLFIIIGGLLTRYFGFEGILHVREGATTGYIITGDTYMRAEAFSGGQKTTSDKKVMFSDISNRYKTSLKTDNGRYKIKAVGFKPYTEYSIQPGDGGKPLIHIVLPGEKGRENIFLEEGDFIKTDSFSISFNDSSVNADLEIFAMPDMLYLRSEKDISIVDKDNWNEASISANTFYIFKKKALYKLNNAQFVLKEYYNAARLIANSKDFRDNHNLEDTVKLLITGNGKEQVFAVTGKNRKTATAQSFQFDGINFSFSYGAQIRKIPFALKLNDFIITRYPGSNSPSSFESEVTLIDSVSNIEKPYRIYMNNILRYKGFRFYQSSYDTDEKGSYLSVSYDTTGTTVTYLGYLLLVIGIGFSLFNKKSRFYFLQKKIPLIQEKRKNLKTTIALFFIAFLSLLPLHAKETDVQIPYEKIIPKMHAREFGTLLVQDNGGRIKPVNTLSSEILRKVSRKNTIYGLNSDQVLLGMLTHPYFWQEVPVIRVSHPEIKKLLNIQEKYASFNDFLDPVTSSYILEKHVNSAYQKKPAARDKFDNYVIKVNERMNICYMAFTGQFLKIFPLANDPGNKWHSPQEAYFFVPGEDSAFVRNILPLYLQTVDSAIVVNHWDNANFYLSSIKIFQAKTGGEIFPKKSRIQLELFYNNVNIFERITNIYGITGFILMLLQFWALLSMKGSLRGIMVAGKVLISLLFLVHFTGLVIRWAISGHAPWSNGYEALIYIAWIMVLLGLVMSRKSPITLPASSIMAYLILHVAHLSWMDPEITPLVPVLKSYWLLIHVAVITASYSFLALGAILALVNLLIVFFESEKNRQGLFLGVQELTAIIELLLMLGLYLLTIGTFLGAVWANESWGRYWGWDPKESWALVTILVYAVIIHLRLIPSLKSIFLFNFLSLIGFSSVIMTYFGVNYYLSGLHSYAKGDPVPVPHFVYYTLLSVAIIALLSYINHRKQNKNLKIEI